MGVLYMSKKRLYIVLIISIFIINSCNLFGKSDDKNVISKFNEVKNILDASFGVNGCYALITDDIELPTTINDVTLTWTSDKPQNISNTGIVTRTEENVMVTLTVTLSYKNKNQTIIYTVTVKGLKIFTITFDSQGGSFVESITQAVNTVITKPNEPTRTGYSFKGWYESESATEAYVFSTMPNKDLTLYARWERNPNTYIITFDSQGGSAVDSIVQEANTTISKPNDPIREGYAFIGWFENDFVDDDYKFSIMPDKDLTLSARWGKFTIGLEFKLKSDDTYELINYTGTDTHVYVPNVYEGKMVTSIGNNAFKNNTIITSIILPEGIISIGQEAFANCTSLKNIDLPNSLTSIGDNAFKRCHSLNEIVLPANLTSINYNVFTLCINLVIYAKFTTPPSGWYDYLFEEMAVYYGVEEVREFNDFQYLIIDGNITITHYVGKETTIEIPEKIGEYQVTKVGAITFFQCTNITNITIPKGITSIGNYAFYNCSSLISIYIPEGIINIGNYTFANCTSLENITLPEGLKTIGNGAFYKCSSLDNIFLPNSITNIAYSAFNHCSNLKNINLPIGIKEISVSLFTSCSSLESIIIPEGVTIIDDNAFLYCSKLKTIILPNSLTKIDNGAFEKCTSLTNINLPNNLTYLGYSVFADCPNLTSIIIPEGITSIKYTAFVNCSKLMSVKLPNSLTSIENEAFANCTSLININLPENLTSIGDRVFYNCANITNINLPNNLISIGKEAFYNCKSLTGLILPDNLSSIGEKAFYNCINITSIKIPEGVTIIASETFANCNSLVNIILSQRLSNIEDNAFANCTSLTSLILPTNLSNIAKTAFSNCPRLTFYTKLLLDRAGWIDGWENNRPVYYGVEEVFEYNSINYLIINGNIIITRYIDNDTSFEIPQMIGEYPVTSIGKYAFSNSTNLMNLYIPEGVTSIGTHAFDNCSSLINIVLPISIKKIDNNVFPNCDNLVIYAKIPSSYFNWTEGWNSNRPVYYGVDEIKEYNGMQYVIIDGKITITRYVGNNNRLDIPDKISEYQVTSIGNYAFANCTNLSSITIPISVKKIENRSFLNCNSLTIYAKNIAAPNSWINGWNCDRPVYFDVEYVYEFNGIQFLIINDSITITRYIGNETTLEIPSKIIGYKVTTIGNSAFSNSILTSILLTPGIIIIEDSVFENCPNLASVSIPEGVIRIGNRAFYNCSSLTNISLPNSVKKIGNQAFSNCTNLTSINIPEGVTDITEYLFENCINLTTVTLPSSITTIERSAFSNCISLVNIVLPNKLTSIGYRAFENCKSLETITIPNNVNIIGNYAFHDCAKLTIYAKVLNKPSGWNTLWNSSNRPVIWNAK